jgi:hypothetical protein
MVIQIPVEELHITPKWMISEIVGVSIDYADSTVHAVFRGRDESKIIFSLKDYGITLDNRFWGYQASFGKAGIYILIEKNHNTYNG